MEQKIRERLRVLLAAEKEAETRLVVIRNLIQELEQLVCPTITEEKPN